MLHDVDNKSLGHFMLDQPIAVLCFWAEWEKGEKIMKYRMECLSESFPDVNFGMMNVDWFENWEIVKILCIKHAPTILFFVNGHNEYMIEKTQTINFLADYVRKCRDFVAKK